MIKTFQYKFIDAATGIAFRDGTRGEAYTKAGAAPRKVGQVIEFPMAILEQNNCMGVCKAIITKIVEDSSVPGHYTAYVRKAECWEKFKFAGDKDVNGIDRTGEDGWLQKNADS
jgi:hypothetical protein